MCPVYTEGLGWGQGYKFQKTYAFAWFGKRSIVALIGERTITGIAATGHATHKFFIGRTTKRQIIDIHQSPWPNAFDDQRQFDPIKAQSIKTGRAIGDRAAKGALLGIVKTQMAIDILPRLRMGRRQIRIGLGVGRQLDIATAATTGKQQGQYRTTHHFDWHGNLRDRTELRRGHHRRASVSAAERGKSMALLSERQGIGSIWRNGVTLLVST